MIEDADVILYAIGPWVGGKRLLPAFRIRYAGRFTVENKVGTGIFASWRPIGHAQKFQDAINKMNELNTQQLTKRRLTQW